MNNDAPIDNRTPSRARYLWIALPGAVLCLALGTVLVLFLVRASLIRKMPSAPVIPLPSQTPTTRPVTLGPTEDILTLRLRAVNLMYQGKFAEALPLWDEMISRSPEDTAYYQRAVCYYNILPQQRNSQQHDLYAQKALADMDMAISLKPTMGDYYAFRHDVLIAFMDTEEYRVNRQAISGIAHEDAKAAIALGYSDTYRFTDRVYVTDLTTMEQCEESLAETRHLLKSTPAEDSSITGLYRMEAEANACLGNFEEAVQAIDASLRNQSYVLSKTYLKALYLYQLGRLEEALSLMNGSLNSQPGFEGYQYYLRALIYYDLGERDLANADLESGSIYTWGRMGLYAYVSGRIALDAGRQQEGIELLQQAEASLDYNHSLIRTRIEEELAKLGAGPLSLTPSIDIASTPIPINKP